jgi:hypothetical protein
MSGIPAFPRHKARRVQDAFSSNHMCMWRISSAHHRRMHGVQTEHLQRILPIKKISLRRMCWQKFNQLQLSTQPFFVRILGTENTTFCKTKLPGFKNFHMGSLIQYNAKTKHFRCIKMMGKATTFILDGNHITKFKQQNQRKLIQ